MKQLGLLLASVGLIGAANASVNFLDTSVESTAVTNEPNSTGGYERIVISGSRHGSSNTPVETRVATTDEQFMAHGYASTAHARALADGAEASLDFTYGATPDTRGRITSIAGRVDATTYGQADETQPGLVRFTVHYDLRVDGPGQIAGFGFSAYVADPGPEGWGSWAGLGKDLKWEDGVDRLTGSWTSDWMSFATGYMPGWGELTPFHWGSGAYVQQDPGSAPLPASGRSAGYAKVSFSYEVAPIPEPETYALFGVGLAALAMSRRRSTRERQVG